jgi:hypothetical protein
MGTFVDQTIRDHALIPGMFDRMIASDVLKAIQDCSNPDELVDWVITEIEDVDELQRVPISITALTRRARWWVRDGAIPQPWKWIMYSVLSRGGWKPSLIRLGMLHGDDWFTR